MFGCVSGLLLTCQLLSFCWVLSWLGTESSSLVPNNAHSVLTSADLHHIRLPFALEPWPELLPACLDHCPVSSSPVAWFLLNSTEPASGQYTRDQDPPVSSRPGYQKQPCLFLLQKRIRSEGTSHLFALDGCCWESGLESNLYLMIWANSLTVCL